MIKALAVFFLATSMATAQDIQTTPRGDNIRVIQFGMINLVGHNDHHESHEFQKPSSSRKHERQNQPGPIRKPVLARNHELRVTQCERCRTDRIVVGFAEPGMKLSHALVGVKCLGPVAT